MNTTQLQCMIRCDQVLKHKISGVFAADQLQNVTLNTGFIANTDPHSKSGKHWCAFYIDENGHVDFFDSYGRLPRCNSSFFDTWLKKNASSVTLNSIQLQSNESFVCGLYCILFLHQRISGYTLNDFVKCFSTNHIVNDIFVYNMLTKAFDKCTSNKDVFNQCCRSITSS